MKLFIRQLLFIILILFVYKFCLGQDLSISNDGSKNIFHNKDFNWTITIPEGFQNVSREEWKKIQNQGVDILEESNGVEIINQNTTIFVFRSDPLNYFESNYQPFDTLIDGNYLAACKGVNNTLYQTFRSQMPDLKIDTISTVEKIDNLKFQTFKLKVEYPNLMVLNVLIYTRLFDDKELNINIMYVDKIKGQKMVDSWTNSKFSN